MAAAKCVGRSHVKSGTPCQDSVWTESFTNGITVIALADGAGSSKFSHYGSSFVTRKAVELVGEHFCEALGAYPAFDEFKCKLIQQLQLELLQLAETGIDFQEQERTRYGLPGREDLSLVPCSVKDLSCTLLIVAVKGNQYIAIHLGDGVIGAEVELRGERRMNAISVPDNGEFANETHFITSRDARSLARGSIGKLDSPGKKTTGFILMSDGPESALFVKRGRTLASACHKLIAANRELSSEEMNDQLEATLENVVAQKTSDDCSIALLSRCFRP